jgi:uncharacterized protein (TIGR03435 family)
MFDMHLEFGPDESTPRLLPGGGIVSRDAPPPAAFPDDPAGGPSIFTAIEKQLGLKLEPAKGPGIFLVIDHVEKPTDNFEPPAAKQEHALHLPAAALDGSIRSHTVAPQSSTRALTGAPQMMVAAKPQSRPAPVAAQAIQAQPQRSSGQSFEVASIKPAPAGTRGYTWSRRIEAGRLDTTTTVQGLLMWAYDLKVDSQVAGGPVWLDSDKYVVAAKAAGPVSMKQLQQMTRTLLAERFKLTIHRETKEQTVLALVVANKGPKLSRSKFESDDDFSVTIGTGKIIAQRARMDDLANQLTGNQNRIVVDRTGLTGAYDFKLEFTPERPDGSPVPGSDPAGPTILVALQEQLGLKLESIKAPVEVMVIDHAEKPTEN